MKKTRALKAQCTWIALSICMLHTSPRQCAPGHRAAHAKPRAPLSCAAYSQFRRTAGRIATREDNIPPSMGASRRCVRAWWRMSMPLLSTTEQRSFREDR